MPVLDMPLDELKTYQGSSPRPDDFDAFWDKSLKEMQAIDPQVELREAEFQVPFAECKHLFFAGVGGARIHAKLLRPKNADRPHPAVVMFHGYYGDSGDWSAKLAYVAAGFTVAALDCRGQAGLSEDIGGTTGPTVRGHIIRGLNDGPEKLYYRQVFLDAAQLARIVMAMDDVDADRVAAAGGSQGGGLALACAALEPRIKRVASDFPFLSDFRRVWHLDLVKTAYWDLRYYFKMCDPLHEREDEVFNTLAYIDVQNLVPRIKGQVFMGISLVDETCPPSTQFAAYNKITAPKSMALYRDFGHEALRGHPDRVFQFLGRL
ncbi:MAG: alpha/beta fold hydrolase [Anaerolineaceae bacterium]|nr:alpha/beta fold hydrolase [Anaerolineaceae bacterium]